VVTKADYYLIEVVTKAGYYLIEVVTKAGYYLIEILIKYWPAVLTKTNRENKNVKYNTIIYIFSVVDNFELIVGLDVGIPLFIVFPL
jgi:hypothetical protein